jgi:hypothetical protein
MGYTVQGAIETFHVQLDTIRYLAETIVTAIGDGCIESANEIATMLNSEMIKLQKEWGEEHEKL